MNASNRLLTLPHEVQLLIASYLSAPEKQLLRMTCTHYHTILPPPSRPDLQTIRLSFYNFKSYEACLGPKCMRLYNEDGWDIQQTPSIAGATPITVYTCKKCDSGTLPFDYSDSDYAELDWNTDEKWRLRKLRLEQGLGKAFWDDDKRLYWFGNEYGESDDSSPEEEEEEEEEVTLNSGDELHPNTLSTLPHELQLLITSHLSPPEKQLLRMTCKYFHNFLPSPSESDLKAIQDSFYNFKYYRVCLGPDCMRFYPEYHYSVSVHFPPLAAGAARTIAYTCKVCGSYTLPYGECGYIMLERNDDEKQMLRKLRWEQGLGRAFWDDEVYEGSNRSWPEDEAEEEEVPYSDDEHSLVTLSTLPHELQLLITSYLSPPEKQLLRMTCTHFRHVLPPPSEADLKAIAKSFYNYNAYQACLSPCCMRLYPQHKWRLANFPHDAAHICKACGNGTNMSGNFESLYVELNWKFAEEQRVRKLRFEQGLERAFWDRGERKLPWAEEEEEEEEDGRNSDNEQHPKTLSTLPPELQLLITSYLSPPEKQLLRMTCKHFHNFLPSPSGADLESIRNSFYNFKSYEVCYHKDCRRLYPKDNWRREPLIAGCGPSFDFYICRVCRIDTLPFRPNLDELDWNSNEKQRLRKLRFEQGLEKAFWDDEEYGGSAFSLPEEEEDDVRYYDEEDLGESLW